MKMITLWLTPEEKATLEELARNEDVTLSHALREGLKLYFEDAKDWIDERRAMSQALSRPEPERLL